METPTFEIQLPIFEGPFDLLLFFIEKDELDIYDIPIAKLTDDFLGYIHQMKSMDVELASEFILVAGTLMKIKVKTLLPRPIYDEEGNETDPKDELIKHLLEYKKYKSVVEVFSTMEYERLQMKGRGNLEKEIKQLSQTANVEAELQSCDLYKLMKVFQNALKKEAEKKDEVVHQIRQYSYTVKEQKEIILKRLKKSRRLSFREMITGDMERILVIFNFLSILELIQMQIITIQLGEGFNNFWITKK